MKKGESLSQRIAGYASLLVVFFALYRFSAIHNFSSYNHLQDNSPFSCL